MANRKRTKETILEVTNIISAQCAKAVFTKGEGSYQHRWSKRSRAQREETFFAALQRVETVVPSQRMREEAPEITLEGMCVGQGEGFHVLLNHFYREPKIGEDGELAKETDYPLLRHEALWQQWNLIRDADSLPLSRGERAFQVRHLCVRPHGCATEADPCRRVRKESLLLQRHLYLVMFTYLV
mgnify:FL=1